MANFFTSDTHYGHANIASQYGSNWKSGWRGFKDLDDMNQHLVSQINKTVGPDDTLYHLGDWSFGGIDNIWKFRKQVQCRNIHLILGNHDHHIEDNKIITIPTGDLNLAFGLNCTMNTTFRVHDIFSSVSHYHEVHLNGNVYVLSHYGMRVWHGSHKGWIHLYGHSHGSLPPFGKSVDVGVDNAKKYLGDYRPFSEAEIIDFMSKRSIEYADHHEQKTNTGRPPKGKKYV